MEVEVSLTSQSSWRLLASLRVDPKPQPKMLLRTSSAYIHEARLYGDVERGETMEIEESEGERERRKESEPNRKESFPKKSKGTVALTLSFLLK